MVLLAGVGRELMMRGGSVRALRSHLGRFLQRRERENERKLWGSNAGHHQGSGEPVGTEQEPRCPRMFSVGRLSWCVDERSLMSSCGSHGRPKVTGDREENTELTDGDGPESADVNESLKSMLLSHCCLDHCFIFMCLNVFTSLLVTSSLSSKTEMK